jgi:hypothetical protein
LPNIIALLWIKIIGTALFAVLPMLVVPTPRFGIAAAILWRLSHRP